MTDVIEAARAVKCPIHGERFNDVKQPLVYQARWLVKSEWETSYPHNSRQYAKAMRASFPDFPPTPGGLCQD